jgi:succinate dehydrogenase assembly factor 2
MKRIVVRCLKPLVRFESNTKPHTQPFLPGLSLEQIKKIEENDFKLRSQNNKILDYLTLKDQDIARRKRLIYRSKQRGWLEADILMGSWASQFVPTLNEDELSEYETLLDEETIDIFNYITGKDALPVHLKDLKLMKKLQEYASNTNLSTPRKYAEIKVQNNLT